MLFFAVWAGACFFFAVWAGAQAPLKQQKKNTPPPKQQKKNTPPPLPSVFCFFFAVWAGVCVCVCLFFCCLGGGRVFFCCLGGGRVLFLLFGWGRVLFLLFGRGRLLFCAVWAGGVFVFLLFGRGTGVHSLTRLPGSSLSDPTTKETEQQKKTRVPLMYSVQEYRCISQKPAPKEVVVHEALQCMKGVGRGGGGGYQKYAMHLRK